MLEDVMEELKLGPNGGLVYCMEFLRENAENLGFEKFPTFSSCLSLSVITKSLVPAAHNQIF
jgi:hypothetical protein